MPISFRVAFAALLSMTLLAACGDDAPRAAESGPDSAAVAGRSDAPDPGSEPGAATDPDTPDSSVVGAADTAVADTARVARPVVAGRRYDVRSGIIELRSSFMGTQKQIVYFDDYGAREAVHANTESGGTKNSTVMVMAGGSNVVYDPVRKVGTRVDLSDALSQLGLGGIPNLASLDEQAKRELKYSPIAGRTVLGRQAEGASIEVMGTPIRVWSWRGVPLRMEATMQGQKMTVEATSLKTDVDVPDERFVVPSDVRLNDLKP